jgi:hypothetical protein
VTTFADLKTRCASRFRDSANDVVSATEWGEYINDALRHIYSQLPWLPIHDGRATVSLTANTATGTLPTDTYQVHAVYNTTDDFPLEPISNRAAYQEMFAPTDRGTPEFYSVRGSVIEVYPTPDRDVSLQVDYVGSVTLLTSTAEPAFPEQFHHILVEGALGLAYADDGNDEQGDRHWSKFETGLVDMIVFLGTQRTGAHMGITDTFFD